MKNIIQIHESLKKTPSDINEHLDTLYTYGKMCKHITEFGVRWVVSTWSLLATQPNKMISYDIAHPGEFGDYGKNSFDMLMNAVKEYNLNYNFIQNDTTKIIIDETDLLFIDTWHTYDQLICELRLHNNKVKKYIILHDTETFGEVGETLHNKQGPYKGLNYAIKEFLNENKNWDVEHVYKNNNGLTVLKRL